MKSSNEKFWSTKNKKKLVESLPARLKELSVIHILCLITSLVTPNRNQRLKFQLEGGVLNV